MGLGVVGWGWLVWGRLVLWVLGNTLVLDISNIARVGISNIVGHNLGAAIRKSNTVLAIGSIAIPVLIGSKVRARVVISDSISILVDSRLIIRRLMVSWLGVVWSWGRLVDWGWLVNWGWVVWCWLVDNWSWVVDWSWLVDNWGWVVDWGWLVVDWGWLVVGWGMDWDMGWGMDSSRVLLSSIGVVDVLWGSMGLAGNSGVVSSMGLVNSMAHSWGISVLDDLVVALVSSSSGQEGRDSNKSLAKQSLQWSSTNDMFFLPTLLLTFMLMLFIGDVFRI